MYEFTTKNPPLLKVEVDVLQVPGANLVSAVGDPATWIHNWMQMVGFFRTYFERTYTAKRYLQWVLIDPLFRPNTDQSVKRSYTTGYSKQTMDSTSSFVEAGAGMKIDGIFNADVKSSLKIDNTITQTWTEQSSMSVDEQFKAGETYATWALTDTIDITLAETTWLYHDDDNKKHTATSDTIGCVLYNFGDSTEERPRQAALQAAAIDAYGSRALMASPRLYY